MSADPHVVLDLLAATPGVPADQLLTFAAATSEGWGSFHWAQPGGFDHAVQRLQHAPDGFGCRLLTFQEATAEALLDQGNSGKLREAGCVLGLLIDVDSNQRRFPWPPGSASWDREQVLAFYDDLYMEAGGGSGLRHYVPTIAQAQALIESVARPTVALDGGGGVPAVFLLDETVRVADFHPKHLGRLANRFTALFAAAVEGDAWAFDSPHALTSWLRLPSRRSKYHGHTVTVLDAAGPRYSLADIEALAGPDDGRPLRTWGYGASDEEWRTWLGGEAIARPTRSDDRSDENPFDPPRSPWRLT